MSNVITLFPEKFKEIAKKGENMDIQQYCDKILVPPLKVVGSYYSLASARLMLGTTLKESGLNFIEQLGPGDAISFQQIEIETFVDCLRYLNRVDKRKLKEQILAACYMEMFPPYEALMWNMRFSVLIARTKYWMQQEALPHADDSTGLCSYYVKYYNAGGASTFENSIAYFKLAEKHIRK